MDILLVGVLFGAAVRESCDDGIVLGDDFEHALFIFFVISLALLLEVGA
jgi:hypothetical protein